MDWKKMLPAALSLTLAVGMAAPASAAQAVDAALPLLIAPNPNAVSESYNGKVFLDGKEIQSVTYTIPVEDSWETVDNVIPTGELPGAPAGYVPMRLLCQASYGGSASWYPEENQSRFFINDQVIMTHFDDNSVYLYNDSYEEILQEGVSCYLRGGVTYLPADFLNTLEGVNVETQAADGVEEFRVTIDVEPLVKVLRDIVAETGFMGIEVTLEDTDYLTSLGMSVDDLEDVAGNMPMMTSPDTVFIAKVKAGAMETVKAELEAYRQIQAETFSWYLSHNLPKVENASLVDSGDYVMLYIGEEGTNDKAIELFQAGVAALEAAQ